MELKCNCGNDLVVRDGVKPCIFCIEDAIEEGKELGFEMAYEEICEEQKLESEEEKLTNLVKNTYREFFNIELTSF